MSEHPKDNHVHGAGEAQTQPDAAQHYGENAGAEASGEGASADFEALVRLMKENEELKEARLRAAADMENLRRRTQREVADARTYAVANFARDMLTVSDNLRRALDAVPADTKVGGVATLAEGVEMTERAMLGALERHGVKKIVPEGERFDPNFHQAMYEVPNPNVPANTVVQVVQAGFVIGDRVLRPAMVGVAKGGPKAATAQDAAEPGPPNAQAEKDA